MTSALDPELALALPLFPADDVGPDTLATLREFFGAAPPPRSPGPPAIREDVLVPRANGTQLRLATYRPENEDAMLPAIVHLHAGGLVMGAPEMMDLYNRRLAAELGAVIVSVDYRLAPEHLYPAALDDCYAALLWLRAEAAELGVDPTRIGLKGESAGGGLAAALALRMRDEGQVPAFLHLISPMLDDRTGGLAEVPAHLGQHLWTRASNAFAWGAYLGVEPGGVGVSPYAAPGRAKELGGLPPTFIAVGGLDLFLLENMDFARRLASEDVPVELHVYPGAYHGFQSARAEVSRQADRDSVGALRRQLGSSR